MPKTLDITDSKVPVENTPKVEDVVVLPTQDPKKEEKKVVNGTVQKEKKKFNWKVLIFPIVAVLTLTGIALFYYFGIYKLKPVPLSQVLSFDDMFVGSNPLSSPFVGDLGLLSIPQEPRTEVSPLNGMLFSKSEMDEMMGRRPVAVMVNNHVEARPLSGLNSADVVIEANAESGITRHLAIFWSKTPPKVGPIRSLRQYYLEWISEYDPILIRDGCAETSDPRTNACGNVYTYGIKDISTLGAWRVNDGTRFAPHNEYSSILSAVAHGERMNWDSFPSSIQSLSFKRDATINERGEKTTVRVVFHKSLLNGGLYNVEWRYDSSTNSYLRWVGGRPDIDLESNTQLNPKVVVLQEVRMVSAGDDKGRVIITTIGEGDAWILQDGNIVEGKWKKDSRTGRTKYYDSSNNLIDLNRGRLWISMIPHFDGEFAIIEQ